MANYLDDSAVVDLTCPGCGHANGKTVGWLKTHDEFTCAGCGNVTIETTEIAKGLRDAEAEIARLSKGIDESGTIKF
jgi:ribosomal protein S27E